MHASIIHSAVVASCVAFAALAHADTTFQTPAPGSRERRAIMDALRPQVEAAYQLKVKFSVRGLESNGSIALVFVEPLDSAGNVIGSRTTKNSRGEALELDGWVFAIVKKEAKAWRAVEIDMLESVDGLTIWPKAYPTIPEEVFQAVGMATNAEG
jgi:hypothetical protein